MSCTPNAQAYLLSSAAASGDLRMVTAAVCSQPRVLVVDDDPHFRELTRNLLASSGISTAEAESGRDALVYLKAHSLEVQAVIVDMVMPDCDGLEVIRNIRDSFNHLKVLAVSGADARELYLHVSSYLGADSVLPKSKVELLAAKVFVLLSRG